MDIDKFYKDHHANLINLANIRLSCREDAECAVQDVFLNAIRKDGTKIFNDSEHMKNHYEKVVIARAIDIARKSKTKAAGAVRLYGDVIDSGDSGGFNAILDKTEGERMNGDYGEDGPPSYDDYSEDSFP